jgi:hypothetical protein
MANISKERAKKTLAELVRADKEKVQVLLVEESGEQQLDLIEIIKGMKNEGLTSISGIVRIFDYKKQIADSSLLVFIASESEYRTFRKAKTVKISGQQYRVKNLSLSIDYAIEDYESDSLPNNMMITGMFPVLRPLMSDYILMEGERLKSKVPDFSKITGIILPFFERKQITRNFAFLMVSDKQTANDLIVWAKFNWKDGREIRKAVSSVVVIHRDAEKTLKKYKSGRFQRLRMTKEVNDLNLLSANLWREI